MKIDIYPSRRGIKSFKSLTTYDGYHIRMTNDIFGWYGGVYRYVNDNAFKKVFVCRCDSREGLLKEIESGICSYCLIDSFKSIESQK